MTDKKTQAIIARLASEHEGEVIAAARALQRMAEAKGLKLWEFLTTRDQQAHAATNSVWSSGGASGGSSTGGYARWDDAAHYEEMMSAIRKHQERAAKRAEEEMKARRRAKEREAESIYEKMKRPPADEFLDAYLNLKAVWDREKSNWADLRDNLAQAVVRKGSDHLTTWEKEFLLDIFTKPNLSPTQRQKAEQIYNNRF